MEHRHSRFGTGRCLPSSSAAGGKCSSHPAVLSPGWLWPGGAVAAHGGRARVEEPWDAVTALFVLPAAGESGKPAMEENWSETTRGKYPRAPSVTMLRDRREHLKEGADCCVLYHF